MHKQTAEFRFQLGELVYLRTHVYDVNHTPRECVVVEQIGRWCMGGFQAFYSIGVDGSRREVAEIELTGELRPYQPACGEVKDERLWAMLAEMAEFDGERYAALEVARAERRAERAAKGD